jgi:hypothetical protein
MNYTLTTTVLAATLTALPLAASAYTQAPAEPGTTTTPARAEEVVTATARIEKIDKSKRTLTLKAPDGRSFTVKVPPEMTRFSELKVGDQVRADYYESVAVSILPPGSKPVATERTGMERGSAGEAPGGVVAREVTASARVVSVDAKKGTVTFRGPDGQQRTSTVKDPEVRQRLQGLKPGDTIQLKYTEAMAVSVEPAPK